MLYQFWYSYDHLTEAKYIFVSHDLSIPLRAVLLSDLHDHEFGEGNARLVDAVAAESPDVIFLAGDMLSRDSENSKTVTELIERLALIAPVYYSLGNHEVDYIRYTDQNLVADLEAAGATVLDLAYEDIELNGQTIRIGGMYDYAFARDWLNSTDPNRMKPSVYAFLTEFQDTELPKLMLAHRPDSFIFGQAAQTWDVDLVLSGHLHGGQVVLPFVGGLWGGDQRYFPEYVHGLYEKEKIHILITSGLGSNPQKVPRLNNPPEIVVLTLANEE